jgi:hypothetical protein
MGDPCTMSSAINTILADVNLSTLSFSDNGRNLTMEFINMNDGNPCAQMTASGIVAFQYQNTFENDDDAFPVYVGEVTWQEFGAKEAAAILSQLGYGFFVRGATLFIPKSGRFHIHVEGGAVMVDLICNEYRLTAR